MTQPIYPPGTPEYDAYREALTAELELFAVGAPPYEHTTPEPTPAQVRAWNRAAGLGR